MIGRLDMELLSVLENAVGVLIMSKSGTGAAVFGVGESSIEYMHILWYSSSRFTLLAIDLNHLVISSLSMTTWFTSICI
jgi:hypothetical protein